MKRFWRKRKKELEIHCLGSSIQAYKSNFGIKQKHKSPMEIHNLHQNLKNQEILMTI